MQPTPYKKKGKLGRVAYPFRLMGYYFGFACLVFAHEGLDALPPITLAFLSIIFIYPHFGFMLYKITGDNRKMEYFNQGIDSVMLGVFINLIHFSVIPSLVFVAMILSTHAAMQGMKRLMSSMLLITASAALMSLVNGVEVQIESTFAINFLSVLGLSIMAVIYSYLGYVRWKSLKLAQTNIEEQKAEILHQKKELNQINQEKDYLLGIAAHDLKSPLNQIIALIQIIELTDDINDKQAENFNYIKNAAHHMRELIGKILDVNAIESGDLNLCLEVFDCGELTANIVARYLNDAENKQLNLVFNPNENTALVKLDKGYFTQIVENLISNAIKFSLPEKNIFIEVLTDQSKAKVIVRDEGPGISEVDQKMLFHKFQKLTARPTGGETSSGLGLSIVKKFTEIMNGKVTYSSTLGKGSTFVVEFELTEMEEISK